VWFLLSALRADAVTAGSGRVAAASATGACAAAALATAASLSHPSSSAHCLFLHGSTRHPDKPAAPPAARHSESIPLQAAIKPGLYDLRQFTGHKRNDPDAVCRDHFVQSSGNRTTNQSADAQFRKPKSFLNRQVILQEFLCFANSTPGFGFDNVNLPNHVKDGSYSILPGSKCRFHCPAPFMFFREKSGHLSCQHGHERTERYNLFI
jgi:hypothetical protein